MIALRAAFVLPGRSSFFRVALGVTTSGPMEYRDHFTEHMRADDPPAERVRVIQFADARWRVSVRPLPALGGRLALVFDCPQALRIVKHYPADWYTLSDADLAALSLRV